MLAGRVIPWGVVVGRVSFIVVNDTRYNMFLLAYAGERLEVELVRQSEFDSLVGLLRLVDPSGSAWPRVERIVASIARLSRGGVDVYALTAARRPVRVASFSFDSDEEYKAARRELNSLYSRYVDVVEHVQVQGSDVYVLRRGILKGGIVAAGDIEASYWQVVAALFATLPGSQAVVDYKPIVVRIPRIHVSERLVDQTRVKMVKDGDCIIVEPGFHEKLGSLGERLVIDVCSSSSTSTSDGSSPASRA